ncbi:hypothetical protein [Okeania sp. KiyG1]|nr:hypothetical protein [Okeania sp. KiyG1]
MMNKIVVGANGFLPKGVEAIALFYQPTTAIHLYYIVLLRHTQQREAR